MKHLLPAWLQNSEWRQHLHQDIIAGLVVGIVVIPQSLGYALLAGLPPVYGLYAAIVPVLIYALIGASNTQAVGPVAITSIMTAQALVPFAQSHSSIYIALAAFMALLVGVILLFAALLKLGWIMQFISRGVMAAFITGAAVLIITGQVKYILGVRQNPLRMEICRFWPFAVIHFVQKIQKTERPYVPQFHCRVLSELNALWLHLGYVFLHQWRACAS